MTFLLNHIFSLFITLVAVVSLLYNAHLLVVIERQRLKIKYLLRPNKETLDALEELRQCGICVDNIEDLFKSLGD